MHELSICQALLDQVAHIARARGAESIERITIEAGPLCGTEPVLLHNAFRAMRVGLAAAATLIIKRGSVTVRCVECGATSEVKPNKLICAHCAGWRTELMAGNELRLLKVELRMPDELRSPELLQVGHV